MKTYNLLHIDDSKTDADLIKRQLQKAGISDRYMLVDNESDFKKGMATFKPDIILCDHSMPNFSSKAAFDIYKKAMLNIPFILVTGTVSEEFAVEMLQAGIDDYLLKTNLQRLPNAIKQAYSKRKNERQLDIVQLELQQSETQLRTIFENSAVGLVLLNMQGDIIQINNLAHYYLTLAFGQKFSIHDNFIKNKNLAIENFREKFQQVLSGKTVKYEAFYPREFTAGISFSISINPVIDEYQTVAGCCMTIEDITERKKVEQHLKLLESVITHTNDAVMITDIGKTELGSNKIIYVNEALSKMTGYSNEEIIGKTPKILQGPLSDENELKRLSEAMKRLENCECTIVNYKKNGDTFWNNFSVSPVADENGLFTHYIAIERDVTESKLHEIQLMQLNESLQKQTKKLAISNEDLEQFAYIASHDLQEPLRMVSSFLNLLEKKYETLLDENGKTYIRFAVDGAKRMRLLILDLLQFSRIGKESENIETIDINQLIDEIKQLYSKEISEKNATIEVDKLPQILAHISPVRQVFQNLISNALKYSAKITPAKISISANDMGNEWQFSVADNGIGINKVYFDKIFIIFQRLHNTSDIPGTGLGLAITKKIIAKMGGKIWVTSEEGKGSSFYFTLPKEMQVQ
jgi:PAS domain S-box-containing protein